MDGSISASSKATKVSKKGSLSRDWKKNKSLYLMILPVLAFYITFCYVPMYGALMAFQNYSPRLGMFHSKWVGFDWFIKIFTSSDFPRLLKNTLTISITTLVVSFPIPILFALFVNEISNTAFKKVIQTVSYLPHFISLVVICGMIKTFVSETGIIGAAVGLFTGKSENLLINPNAFLPIYAVSNIWQTMGWDSIMYLAAITAIDTAQYEAAEIDGAGRFCKMFKITLPSIKGTIIVLLILKIGGIMGLGYEKIMLLYNPAIYSKSDVLSTYVYRLGFEGQNWSQSTALGLFNAVVNLILVVTANRISNKISGTGLW